MLESSTTVSPPVLIYLCMGLIMARVLLVGTNLRGQPWLVWLQFLVKAGSITLLWPLVLFLEKFEQWLKSSEEESK